MTTVGIVCEYNPFHNGHLRQMQMIRQALGENTGVVCLMSGNYVQRGEPAMFAKELRAKAAVCCGADLVLELPITCALSSAEGFAAGAVEIFTRLGIVHRLCFGSESGDEGKIMATAAHLLQPDFSAALRQQLRRGVSFAAARQAALAQFGPADCLSSPNDILAVEYAKAIFQQNSPLRPLVVQRSGAYQAATLTPQAPSSQAIRSAIERGTPWQAAVPAAAQTVFAQAAQHRLSWGQRAVVARLRCLTEQEFAALPYGAEGLWRKLSKACRSRSTVEDILQAAKSKRYARTRLQRMLMCGFLGITEERIKQSPSYVRVLAFNDQGRRLLRQAKSLTRIPIIDAGQRPMDAGYYDLECRAADLYSLFLPPQMEPVWGSEEKLRNFYQKTEKGLANQRKM